jgi:hypothetical protein
MSSNKLLTFALAVVAAAGIKVLMFGGGSEQAPQVVVQWTGAPALAALPEAQAQAAPPPLRRAAPDPGPAVTPIPSPSPPAEPPAAAPPPLPPAEPEPAPAPAAAPAEPVLVAEASQRILRPDAATEKPREPQTVTIPAGTLLTVRLREALGTEMQSTGEPFQATLDQPLEIEGFVLAERGASVRGRVVTARRAGRMLGRARLAVELTQLNTSDGQRVDIQTDAFTRETGSSAGKDAARVGVAAGLGAALGTAIGGPRGAILGGAIGGASGAGSVLLTRGDEAGIPIETRLTFRLKEPVTLTERLKP